MKRLSYILILLPFSLIAQTENNGIRFERISNWNELILKAKAEKKHIFVDCYATWCAPCKRMDRDVYPLKEVGNYINEKFISIKIQIDKTNKDDDYVRSWYSTATQFQEHYKITGFPTFLFFTSDGKIIHRDLGEKSDTQFLALAKDAISPEKQRYVQYSTLLESYKNGGLSYAEMPQLAKIAKTLNDQSNAKIIARDYKINYLEKLDWRALLKRKNIDFITEFYELVNSKDNFFKLFYFHGEEVDQIAGKGTSDRWVKYIISREEIDKRLWLDNGNPITKNPNWEKISSAIKEKYNSTYAEILIPTSQMEFYKRIEDWKAFSHLRNKFIKENPPQGGKPPFDQAGTWLLNVDAWALFMSCSDKSLLKNALGWINLAIKLEEPSHNIQSLQYLDTKANLLYKLGEINEAITVEQKAIELGVTYAKQEGNQKGYFVDEFTEVINKMKSGIPTWKVK